MKYVVFDKTGTITYGKPVVTDIVAYEKYSEEKVLKIAASIENNSEHPLAEAIVKDAQSKDITFEKTSGFNAIPGYGVSAKVGKVPYYFGNEKLMKNNNIETKHVLEKKISLENEGKTVMILSDSKKIIGLIGVADTIKDTSKEAVTMLSKMHIETYMITGDNQRTAKAIAAQAGIKNVFSEVLPQDKAKIVKNLQEKGRVAMVGDGINDAPALAQADIGIAMGSGTDVAMESGNFVLMKNDLLDVPRAIKLSRATMSKIRQNMFFALFYNVIGIPIAAGLFFPFTGWLLSPIIAGGAMALSSVSVVTNSLMLRNVKL
ncbi:MAG: heavy metal translocating P-type ATPase [archaeon]